MTALGCRSPSREADSTGLCSCAASHGHTKCGKIEAHETSLCQPHKQAYCRSNQLLIGCFSPTLNYADPIWICRTQVKLHIRCNLWYPAKTVAETGSRIDGFFIVSCVSYKSDQKRRDCKGSHRGERLQKILNIV